MCERNGTEAERAKKSRERSGERESKKSGARSWRSRSGERKSQKWALTRSGKTAPLRSNAVVTIVTVLLGLNEDFSK